MSPADPKKLKELEDDSKIVKIFLDIGFNFGRMIAESKRTYRDQHPKNLVVFNANICTREDGKIWFGDVDITLDEPALKKIAKKLGKRIYVLWEMDARFDTESSPLFGEFVYATDGNDSEFGPKYQKYRETK